MLASCLLLGSTGVTVAGPTPAPIAPYLTASTNNSYSVGAAATVVNPSVTLTANPSEVFTAGKVSIGAGYDASDELLYTQVHGITGSYDAAAGTLFLTGAGTAAEYQDAFRSVMFRNNDVSNTNTTNRTINFSIGDALYSEDNGHFYELIEDYNWPSWTTAKSLAEGKSFYGLQGYLVTVTSLEENAFLSQKVNSDTWMGASDKHTEGVWRWVSGPEGLENSGLGRQFSEQFLTGGVGGCSGDQAPGINGYYANWAPGEPNDCGGDEDVAHFIGGSADWNDYPDGDGFVGYYIVEYGGMPGDPTVQVADNMVLTVNGFVNNSAPVLSNATITINEDAVTNIATAIDAANPNLFSDADGDEAVDIRFTALPTNGTIIIDFAPAIIGELYDIYAYYGATYVPDADFNGTDGFSIEANDGQVWAANAADITVNITAVNDAPVLENLIMATNEDQSIMIVDFSTPTTYTDVENDDLVNFQIVQVPSNGVLSVNGQVIANGDLVSDANLSSLTYIPSTDYHGADSFVWNATDGNDFAAANGTASITIRSVNDAPLAVGSSNASVDENSAPGIAVTTLNTTDVDAGDSHYYQLISGIGSTGNVYFNIAGDQLVVANNINYEATTQLSVRLQTVDQAGETFERVLVLGVNDKNDAPNTLTLSNNTVNEQQPAGTFVGIINTADEDNGDSHTLALVSGAGDADNALFALVNNVLTTNAVLDFNTQVQYTIRVSSTDAAGAIVEEVFIINLSDINQAPTGITLSNAVIAENNLIGRLVGYFATADVDAGDTHTYALVSGAGDDDNASFSILNNDLNAAMVFDFETKSSYTVRVRATDKVGAHTEEVFVITVLDATDAPVGITMTATSIDENLPAGTLVGTISTNDPDQTGGHVYSLVAGAGSDDNGSFAISGSGLVSTTSFNFEAKSSYTVRVRSVDNIGGYTEEVFAISINDKNDSPTDVTVTVIGVDENTPIGTAVGFINAIDADLLDSHTFTLAPGFGGVDNGQFTIAANKLQLGVAPNFEQKSSYEVRLRATDNAGAFVEKYLVVSINDVNETPSAITLSAVSIDENMPAGAIIGTLSTVDQDNADSHVYDFATGAGDSDNAAFYISGNMLIANASYNFEAKNSYSIRVSSTDLGGLQYEEVFTITINDKIDAPVMTNFTKVIFRNTPAPFATREFYNGYSQEEGRTLQYIKIASLPTSGDLLHNNVPLVVGQTILVAELSSMTYSPMLGYVGVDDFTFSAFDGVSFSADAVYTLNVIANRQVGTAVASLTSATLIRLRPTAIANREAEGTVGMQEVAMELNAFGNYPNPFDATTNITFELPVSMKVTLEVYDLLGRKVDTLVDGEELNGKQTIQWNGQGAGAYICRIVATNANGEVITKTINIMQVK